MKKNVMAVFLSMMLAGSTLAGCGNEGTTGSDQTDQVAGEASDSGGQSGERETLVLGVPTQRFVTDYKDNYLTKLLEDELNVNLEFYELPAEKGDLETKVSLMAASGGEDIPDVIMYKGFTPETVLDYGNRGFFIPLNEYYEKTDTNYSKIPEKDREAIEQAMTLADGNIYALPNYSVSPWNDTPNRIYMNTAWLDKLGLEVPETTDELYEVLKAFVNEDPNGNGKKDEIGLYGFMSGTYGQDIIDTIMNAFVFYNGGAHNGGLALDETGNTIVAPFVTEEWKEGLKYMNKLYNEGLLASSIFTDDDTQFKATLNSEENVVGMVSAGSTSNWTDCDNNPNFIEMDMVAPFIGPEGVCYTPYTVYSTQFNYFITSACQNPDLAFKLGDWFMTEEHSKYGRYGEKGVDWTDDPKICEENTNAYVEAGAADGVTCTWLTNIWSEPSNKFWYNINPYYNPLNVEMSVANGVVPFDKSNKSSMGPAYNLEWYSDKHPEHVLPLLQYTSEDLQTCNEIMMNVKDLVENSKAEFITGARDFESGWESYLQELEQAGLNDWMEIAQKTYDESKS